MGQILVPFKKTKDDIFTDEPNSQQEVDSFQETLGALPEDHLCRMLPSGNTQERVDLTSLTHLRIKERMIRYI
jgi:hypothetical protein